MIARGARGGIHMNSSEALTETMAPKLAGLSTRESLVLELLREHRSLGAIAGALGVSRATINSQAQSIYRKLGVSSRGELREAIAAMDPQTEPGRIQREMTTPRTRVAFASRNRERGVPGWVQRPLTVVR
jgi:DNA-binding CsgD family transcriptional regulator